MNEKNIFKLMFSQCCQYTVWFHVGDCGFTTCFCALCNQECTTITKYINKDVFFNGSKEQSEK